MPNSWSLRNHAPIAEKLGTGKLYQIRHSIKAHFEKNRNIKRTNNDLKYQTIEVKNIFSSEIITLAITREMFGAYSLALKSIKLNKHGKNKF